MSRQSAVFCRAVILASRDESAQKSIAIDFRNGEIEGETSETTSAKVVQPVTSLALKFPVGEGRPIRSCIEYLRLMLTVKMYKAAKSKIAKSSVIQPV